MKFGISNRIKIMKLSDSDPKYLLYKTGTIIDIIKDDYPYKILFDDEKANVLGLSLWKEDELELIDSEEIALYPFNLPNDRNISDAFYYLKGKRVTPELYEKLWELWK